MKKRYFLIGVALMINGKQYFSNTKSEGYSMPSEEQIKSERKNSSDEIELVTIISIYEFKNETDYKNFIK